MDRSEPAHQCATLRRTTGEIARDGRAGAAAPGRSYVGRQEIVDQDRTVVGYELLYRRPPGAPAEPWDADAATEHVAETLLAHRPRLVGNLYAFVNATRSFLLSGSYRRLSPHRTVLEITEDTSVDGALVDVIVAARAQGYGIALDDFQFDGLHDDLVPLADVIKVDVLDTGDEPISAMADRVRGVNPNASVLGEKVENMDHVETCMSTGYDLLQGYAISRPERITCLQGLVAA